MTTPDEYEASFRRYSWRQIQKLDVLHSELASLYRTKVPDRKRINMLWKTIENAETELLMAGVNYEQYTQDRQARA